MCDVTIHSSERDFERLAAYEDDLYDALDNACREALGLLDNLDVASGWVCYKSSRRRKTIEADVFLWHGNTGPHIVTQAQANALADAILAVLVDNFESVAWSGSEKTAAVSVRGYGFNKVAVCYREYPNPT